MVEPLVTRQQPRTSDLTEVARQLLRQCLLHEDDAVRTIDSLGHSAIRVAAQASERLDRGSGTAIASDGVLRELQALADAYAHPTAQKRRLPFGWGSRPATPVRYDLNALVQSLQREKDSVERVLIAVQTDRRRLQDAEGGLDEALALIRACMTAFEAAGRELSIEKPDSANLLSGTLHPRLIQRERDVLTQIAVTRQGVLTLQLVADGQAALGEAIDRARDTSVTALRTAMAARRAVAHNRDLLEQAQALEHTADAARITSQSDRAVETALADALEQARRAIEAAQVSSRTL